MSLELQHQWEIDSLCSNITSTQNQVGCSDVIISTYLGLSITLVEGCVIDQLYECLNDFIVN